MGMIQKSGAAQKAIAHPSFPLNRIPYRRRETNASTRAFGAIGTISEPLSEPPVAKEANIDAEIPSSFNQGFSNIHAEDNDAEDNNVVPATDDAIAQATPSSPIAAEETDDRSPCILTSKTEFAAPNGAPDTRTHVGVGERVILKCNKWVKKNGWSSSSPEGQLEKKVIAGYIPSLRQRIWTAPTTPGPVTITAEPLRQRKFKSGKKTFNVIAPKTVQYTSAMPWLPDSFTGPGTGMKIDMAVSPDHVNFGNVRYRELPGPPSAVQGCFKHLLDSGIADLKHQPRQHFARIDSKKDNRIIATDTAALDYAELDKGNPICLSGGSFQWSIPIEYADGKQFADHSIQSFAIDTAETTTIVKHGSSGKSVKSTKTKTGDVTITII